MLVIDSVTQMKTKFIVEITNKPVFLKKEDIVAWQIPQGRIASYYLAGIYRPPDGWHVVQDLQGWSRGNCPGEWRPKGV